MFDKCSPIKLDLENFFKLFRSKPNLFYIICIYLCWNIFRGICQILRCLQRFTDGLVLFLQGGRYYFCKTFLNIIQTQFSNWFASNYDLFKTHKNSFSVLDDLAFRFTL